MGKKRQVWNFAVVNSGVLECHYCFDCNHIPDGYVNDEFNPKSVADIKHAAACLIDFEEGSLVLVARQVDDRGRTVGWILSTELDKSSEVLGEVRHWVTDEDPEYEDEEVHDRCEGNEPSFGPEGHVYVPIGADKVRNLASDMITYRVRGKTIGRSPREFTWYVHGWFDRGDRDGHSEEVQRDRI